MNKTTVRKNNPMYGLILICLFCSTLDVFNRSYIFVFMAAALFLLYASHIVANGTVLTLMIYAVSLLILGPEFRTSVFAMIKPFIFPISFIIGYGLFSKESAYRQGEKKFNNAYILLIVLAAGALLHYLLNWSINLAATDRMTKDFWSGKLLVATNQAAMACLAVGVSVGILMSGTKPRYWLPAVATIVAILGYNMILSGRTIIVMILAVALVALMYNMRNNRSGRALLLIGVIVFAVAAVWAYNSNMFGLRTFIEKSSLFGRFTGTYGQGLTEDTRMDNKMGYLQNLILYPFGGAHLRAIYGYAHDLFLDSFDEAGWIAGWAVVIYVCTSVRRLLQLMKRRSIPFRIKLIFMCVYLVAYMEFCVEPVLQASPWLLSAFCAIDGCTCAMLNMKAEKVEQPVPEV